MKAGEIQMSSGSFKNNIVVVCLKNPERTEADRMAMVKSSHNMQIVFLNPSQQQIVDQDLYRCSTTEFQNYIVTVKTCRHDALVAVNRDGGAISLTPDHFSKLVAMDEERLSKEVGLEVCGPNTRSYEISFSAN
jgi:hypothetical protein